MRKSLTSVLTILGFVLGAALVPSVSAQAYNNYGLIDTIRSLVPEMEAQMVHVDQVLIDINEEIGQIKGKLLHAMHLISSGKGKLGKIVHNDIQAAIQEKEVIITVKFQDLNDFLGMIDEGLGELIGLVEAAGEEHKMNPKKVDKIKALLLGAESILEFISLDAAIMEALLEDGDDGEDLDDPETFDDVDDYLEFCLENQIADDFDDFVQCKESLGRALEILADFNSIKASAIKKKKNFMKRLITVKKLLLSTAAPKVKKVDALGSETVQVYTLTGQLVLTDRASNALTIKSQLSNGVYLVVTGSRVERLVVLN